MCKSCLKGKARVRNSTQTKADSSDDDWDGFSEKYSEDQTQLIRGPALFQPHYEIKKGTKIICDGACGSLHVASVTIPDSVISIGGGAFRGCFKLTSVTIPNSVISIGEEAFHLCSKLTSVTIPNSVTSIGPGAFSWCENLTSITIPSSVTSIGGGAFSGCKKLNQFNIIGDNFIFEDGALYNRDKTVLIQYLEINKRTFFSNILFVLALILAKINIGFIKYALSQQTHFCIPSSVTTIDKGAISLTKRLVTVTIPNSVSSIGPGAFSWCKNLIYLTIPDSVVSIGDNAFLYNEQLKSLTILGPATSLGVNACFGCKALKKIDIPASITSIENHTFYGCSSLTSVTIPDSVISIGDGAFGDADKLQKINIPSSVMSIGSCPFCWCKKLISINIVGDNFIFEDGVLYNRDKTALIQYFKTNKRTTFLVPGSVRTICFKAFYGCHNLKEITISDSVTILAKDGSKKNASPGDDLMYLTTMW